MNSSTLHPARKRKLAQNQALFREVNDRIHELAGRWSRRAQLDIVCECSDESCAELIPLAFSDYEPVRHFATRFLVLPGHEIPELERVVLQGSGYIVVEKFGPAAEAVRTYRRDQGRSEGVIA